MHSKMTEATASTTSNKYKRAVIGGLLSATPAVITWAIGIFEINDAYLGFILFIGFSGPTSFIFGTNHFSSLLSVINVLIWFLIGAVIAGLIRKNVMAVACWVIVVAASSILMFVSVLPELN
jgi:hypothetical protein